MNNEKNIGDLMNLLSDIDKSLKNNLDENIDSLEKLKIYIDEFRINFNEKLTSNNERISENNQIEKSNIDYDFLKKSLEELKIEWHNKELKDKLTAGLNGMLSDKIEQIFKTLNSTEDSHNKLAERLVSLF